MVGVLYGKGGNPKRLVLWVSPNRVQKTLENEEKSVQQNWLCLLLKGPFFSLQLSVSLRWAKPRVLKTDTRVSKRTF